MNRADMLGRLDRHRGAWDLVVIGGGATGAGVAVDAASRGYTVLLLEQSDFGKGTSSRSTKLVHGGVRYLQQGNLSLVLEALRERGLLLRNAPHVVTPQPFVVPNYAWWESPFYGAGLTLYNLLAGTSGFGRSSILSRQETLTRLPTLRADGLRGGVVYFDGQFDDARLLINLMQTAAEQGAVLLNYVQVTAVTKRPDGQVDGVIARDLETGQESHVSARIVINAAGPFVDEVRRLADADARPMIAPSQGVHLVFPPALLGGESAMMVPHTTDGRVMFAIPWQEHTLVGTTDTPIERTELEPQAQGAEIDQILETAGRYLREPPARKDVLSVFTGIRPLVRSGDSRLTAALSRDHTIKLEPSGMLTTTGGKWTTYRRMAEETVDQAARRAGLAERACTTRTLRIHGFQETASQSGDRSLYGSDAAAVAALEQADASLSTPLDRELPYTRAQVVWAARMEMARTVEDVLGRRCRALFLNVAAAIRMAPAVAALLARELGHDAAWQERQVTAFSALARHYTVA